jgi:hypothetical protein
MKRVSPITPILYTTVLIIAVLLLAAIGFSSFSMSTLPWQVIDKNVTIYGDLTGIPCGALMLSCVTYPNQSLIVQLIKYKSNYYYVSNYTIVSSISGHTTYSIWFTNSTDYCISPKVAWERACPAR